MADYRTIPAAELGKGSNIKVELCETCLLYTSYTLEMGQPITKPAVSAQ